MFVVGPGDKVMSQKVTVEQRERGTALISEGLKPGQSIVTQGQYRLTDGTVVKPSKAKHHSAGRTGTLPVK